VKWYLKLDGATDDVADGLGPDAQLVGLVGSVHGGFEQVVAARAHQRHEERVEAGGRRVDPVPVPHGPEQLERPVGLPIGPARGDQAPDVREVDRAGLLELLKQLKRLLVLAHLRARLTRHTTAHAATHTTHTRTTAHVQLMR
jgi:hypothetical protein